MDVDLNACINGDKRAWDAFVDRWSGVIIAAVHRAVSQRSGRAHRGDLDDAVQEVFVRLIKDDYRLLRSYDPARASLSTWLTLVARSAAIDWTRKRRLETTTLDSRSAPSDTSSSIDPNLPPIPMHVLSPRQRLVMRMLFDEEMSVAEAARLIDVDEQTIRSTKHKALTKLREHMAVGESDSNRGDAERPNPVEPETGVP
jgi:DNA-directed RNA polymerase specialized sigma24 family protein